MANEKRLIPDGEEKVTLGELLPGTIFAFGDDCIAVKGEYMCPNGLIEAFIVDSGEQFWGGAKTAKEQNELMVQPLEIVEVDAVEVVHGRWLFDSGRGRYFCSACNEEALYTTKDEPVYDYDWEENLRYSHTETFVEEHLTNYCPNCGAKMDGDGNG